MQLADMEEGLYHRNCIKRLEYKTNCCTRYIPYLRLIFLLEIMLFFGWGCYMILRTYHPEEMKNEARSIIPERYPMIDSLSDKQKSHPEMSATFVKPEIIIDKINNLLENMKSASDQNLMQNKAFVTNVPNMMQTNMQNSSNVRSNNIVEISAINKLLVTLSPGNLMHDEKFTKNPETRRFSSVQYIDKNVNIDENEKYAQFLEKLRNINKMKAANDLETFESRYDFTKNLNRWRLKNQENHVLDASNKLENLELNIATIINPENFEDPTINIDLINLQDPKQEFSDLTKDAALNDRNENSFLFEKLTKPVKAHLELGLIICPPYESREFSDILIKDSAKDSSTYQPVLTQEISEQIENGSSDERNEDKHDINDSDMSISASTSGNIQDHFDVSAQSIDGQYSSESIAKIKKDEKYGSTENIKNSWFLQPTVKDSVESTTPNIDQFQWFNAPPSFVDLGLGDIPKSSEIHSSLLQDTYENMDVDDIIPGSQCEMTIKMGILKVKCPAIKFDEEWNFASSPTAPPTDVPNITNFNDILDVYLHTLCDEDANKKLEVENISNENFDKEVTVSPDSISKIINAMELQESTASATSDALLDLSDVASIEPFDREEFNQDYPFYGPSFYDYPFYSFPFYDSNEEEVKQVTSSSISEFDSTTNLNKGQNPFPDISDAQQQGQLKQISKEQDYSASDNTDTFSKNFEHFYALEEKLTSLFKNEMSNIITRYLPKNFYKNNYRNNICSILRYMHSISQHPWREQYVALSKLLEHIRNSDYPHNTDDSYYRKKRMADDLTWQQGMSTIIFKK